MQENRLISREQLGTDLASSSEHEIPEDHEPRSAPTQKPIKESQPETHQDEPAAESIGASVSSQSISTPSSLKNRVEHSKADPTFTLPAAESKGEQRKGLPFEQEARMPLSRMLRLRQRRRGLTDAAPNPDLKLDVKTLEHLKPLIDLEGISRPKDINLWYSEWTSVCNIVKIAEGSFGSVFKMSDKQGVQSSTIGKLIPLRSKSGVGSRKASNTTVANAASEVQLLGLMSDVPGFVEFRVAEVLIGALPIALREEYHTFNAKQRRGSSESSGAETSFPAHQAWLFIEMGNAGVELDRALSRGPVNKEFLQVSERGERFMTVRLMRDIFRGIVRALAAGEEAHQFEHRDLHLSNICVLMQGKEPESDLELMQRTESVVVTIIDYTLSRAALPSGAELFNPMLDQGIFQAEGDYQFDIYRYMRDIVTSPTASDKNDWASYVPMTNVLWLHLVLRKVMKWTSRRVRKTKEEDLWELLRELSLETDPDHVQNWNLLSAADVARFMEIGKEAFLREIREEGKDAATEIEGEGAVMAIWRERRLRRILDS